jgi:hypothetical protein
MSGKNKFSYLTHGYYFEIRQIPLFRNPISLNSEWPERMLSPCVGWTDAGGGETGQVIFLSIMIRLSDREKIPKTSESNQFLGPNRTAYLQKMSDLLQFS